MFWPWSAAFPPGWSADPPHTGALSSPALETQLPATIHISIYISHRLVSWPTSYWSSVLSSLRDSVTCNQSHLSLYHSIGWSADPWISNLCGLKRKFFLQNMLRMFSIFGPFPTFQTNPDPEFFFFSGTCRACSRNNTTKRFFSITNIVLECG